MNADSRTARRTRRGDTSITDRLRADIVAGRLAPGSRLVELDLAAQYGVGRATVRAGLVELEAEGLVERTPNRGATVRRLSTSEAVAVTEARCLLETFAAERAASIAADDERAELHAIATAMRDAVGGGDLEEYSQLNALLHRRIREIARQPVVAEMIENLRNRVAAFGIRLAMVPGRPERSLPEHLALVDAIVEGDVHRAGRAAQAHIESVLSALRAHDRAGAPVH